jgi:hypothetical protein
MDKNDLELIFIPHHDQDVADFLSPEPSYKTIPQWYRDLAKHTTTNDLKSLCPVNDRGGDGSNVSTKLCLPFQDAMSLGYMYLLEDDLEVTLDVSGKPSLSWKKNFMMMDTREHVDLAIPKDVHPIHFGVKMQWYYETPKDYSLFMTMPINRPDLPFWTPSAIVDSDIWGLPPFIPFFIKRNFEGIIPMGTPICQMIPIKREPWNLIVDDSSDAQEKHHSIAENRRSDITSHYRKFAWRKKEYAKYSKEKVNNKGDK